MWVLCKLLYVVRYIAHSTCLIPQEQLTDSMFVCHLTLSLSSDLDHRGPPIEYQLYVENHRPWGGGNSLWLSDEIHLKQILAFFSFVLHVNHGWGCGVCWLTGKLCWSSGTNKLGCHFCHHRSIFWDLNPRLTVRKSRILTTKPRLLPM